MRPSIPLICRGIIDSFIFLFAILIKIYFKTRVNSMINNKTAVGRLPFYTCRDVLF